MLCVGTWKLLDLPNMSGKSWHRRGRPGRNSILRLSLLQEPFVQWNVLSVEEVSHESLTAVATSASSSDVNLWPCRQ